MRCYHLPRRLEAEADREAKKNINSSAGKCMAQCFELVSVEVAFTSRRALRNLLISLYMRCTTKFEGCRSLSVIEVTGPPTSSLHLTMPSAPSSERSGGYRYDWKQNYLLQASPLLNPHTNCFKLSTKEKCNFYGRLNALFFRRTKHVLYWYVKTISVKFW